MNIKGLIIAAQPITPQLDAYLLFEHADDILGKYKLQANSTVCFSYFDSKRYCSGWYDIATHTNYTCSDHALINSKYDSCFECRKKTDFNPAFYNTSQISAKQAIYNDSPHSVYIAYFGNGLAKAGIMSDSRGLNRLYEQGAILYSLITTCPNATVAHNFENRLIQKGLKNSITKKQKASIFEKIINIDIEKNIFRQIIDNLDYEDKEIISNLDLFFFENYPKESIISFGDNPISGKLVGIVGRYAILENNERFYGFWLSDIFGHKIEISENIIPIKHTLQQISLL